MARNSAGTHSLPLANVVSGTAITPTWANTTLADLSTEMTDSLSRSGKGGMTAPLRTADGTVAAPAFSFTSETGTGWYRSAAGVMRAAILGVYRLLLNATGLQVNGTLEVSGALTATAGIVLNAAGTGSGQWARPNLPTVGQQVSTSSSTFSGSSAAYADVTNLTVTITTTGRPVMIALQPDGSGQSYLGGRDGAGSQADAVFAINREGISPVVAAAVVSEHRVLVVGGAGTTELYIPPGSVSIVDVVTAGQYTYKVQYKLVAGTTAYAYRAKLVAFEL